jgi:hypothetical protein
LYLCVFFRVFHGQPQHWPLPLSLSLSLSRQGMCKAEK